MTKPNQTAWAQAGELVGTVVLCCLLGAGGGFILGWRFQDTWAAERVLEWALARGFVIGDVQICWAGAGLQIGGLAGLMVALALLLQGASSD